MITVDDALIDKLCTLSRLEFQGEDRQAIRHDLQNILNMMEKIAEVDTEGYDPLIHITREINRFRADEPETTISKADALRNAPKRDSDYFRVPKFVEKG